ncbi:MAG: histidinol-phosphatase [Pseudomonadota bacterium]
MRHSDYASIHGGHSGQFCLHATDSLEAIVLKYITTGFAWVGITEHMPPIDNRFRYPDQVAAGQDLTFLEQQFDEYMSELRRLKDKYAETITLLVGFETETLSGYESYIPALIQKYNPDYIVGSIHHVEDMGFDISPQGYESAALNLGGLDNLYCRFFDQQLCMLRTLEPQVVGHFDLIRIFDNQYRDRILKKPIWDRIVRNLDFIRDKNLILDFNLRALNKGAQEPYIAGPILKLAREYGIRVAPGDDSHGTGDIGRHMDTGLALLKKAGFPPPWPIPGLPGKGLL